MLKIDEIAGFVELKSVNSSPDKTEYKKFGEDFFDSEILEDRLYYYLWSSFKYDSEVSKWYKNHEDEAWYDLREEYGVKDLKGLVMDALPKHGGWVDSEK